MQKYITEVHFIEAGNFSQYYQIRYLQATSQPVEVRNFILEVLGRKRQRAIISIDENAQSVPSTGTTKREQSQKRQRNPRRNFSEFEKKDIRHKNIVYLKSKRNKYSKEKAVAKFKEDIKTGPFYQNSSSLQ